MTWDEDLEIIAAASPGPWKDGGPDKFSEDEPWTHVVLGAAGEMIGQFDCDHPDGISHRPGHPGCVRARADAAFAVAARVRWPEAVARARELEAEIAALRERLDRLEGP